MSSMAEGFLDLCIDGLYIAASIVSRSVVNCLFRFLSLAYTRTHTHTHTFMKLISDFCMSFDLLDWGPES